MYKGLTLILLSLTAACTTASTDGEASTSIAAQEAANERIVLDCLDLIFNQKKLDEARAQCFTDTYIQHNPLAPDGADVVLGFFAGYFETNPDSSLEIKRSVAKGDLVWVHSRSLSGPDALGLAVVDIFRVKDGKLVEHWDVAQPIPEKSANSNTMF